VKIIDKTLCEFNKSDHEKYDKEIRKLVKKPKYICKKCLRAVSEKEYLCKPIKI
jgi:hypothetical protein